MDIYEIFLRVMVGLVAGTVGGLAGLGGSIIMIPALAMFWGYDDEERSKHHIYMAAAMAVNVIVALSSSILHQKKGAARRDVLIALIPSMAGGMILGVLLSSGSKGGWSLYAFTGFIWVYCLYNIITTIKKTPDCSEDNPSPPNWKMVSVGLVVGVISGYLGIGGGILLVPLLSLTKLPLRHAIAGSAGAMWVSSIIGASMKFYTLPGLGLSIVDALYFALPMGAGALVGAYLGAMLAHKLRLPHLKLVIALILAVASGRTIL